MRRNLIPILAVLALILCAPRAEAQPLVHKFLLEGDLEGGEKFLQARLKNTPTDDEARFGLGVVQFLQTFEHLGASLYKYGLRTERGFIGVAPEIQKLAPQNKNPDKISYAAFRQIIQTWVDDLNRAQDTLAQVKDGKVKLPLQVGLIKIDLFGQKKPVNAAFVLGQNGGVPIKDVEQLHIAFDRGDACWLRGYCNLLAVPGEMMLATDFKELFEVSAHMVFERIDSPHLFLQEEERRLDNFRFENIIDAISFIHCLRFPMKEPARMKKALGHLETMVAQGKEMWKHYLAEEDDDNEWIPNPKQKGVLRIEVSQKMVDEWLRVLDEADLVLQGKRLVPFWRGTNKKDIGINVNKIFTEPRDLDVVLWVQGTAATPYLQKGELTMLANPQTLQNLNGIFGGLNFFGFALWFN